MLFSYPMIVHEEAGYWGGEFPDIEGCNAQGDTLEEILSDAAEALQLHLLSMMIDGEKLPEPSYIKSVRVDDNSFVTLVSANVNPKKKDRSVKKTLTLPQWLNERAEKQGINFSQTLQEALLHKII